MKPKHPLPLPALPISLLLSAAPLAAMPQESQVLFTGAHDVAIPTLATTVPADTTYRLSLSGDFYGNGVPDVVTRQGNQLTLAFDPEILDSQSTLPLAATSMAVIPDPSGLDRDALVFSAFDGLRILQPSAVAPYFPSTVIDGRAIAGFADAMCSADLDGDGRLDLVGVDSSRTRIFGLLNGASGWVPIAHATYGQVRGICALDRYGNGVDEIAVATSTGMKLLGLDDSGPLGFLESGNKPELPAKGPLVAVRGTYGETAEQLVWIAETGTPWEFVLAWGDNQYGALAHLYDPRIVGLAAERMDANASDDLVVSHQHAHKAAVFLNESGVAEDPLLAFPIQQNSYEVVKLLGTDSDTIADGNAVTPCVADLDGDSDIDVYMPIQSSDEHKRAFNTEVLDSNLHVVQYAGWIEENEDESGGLVHIKVDASGRPGAATHVEIVVWRAENGGAGYATDPDPVYESTVPIDETSGYDGFFVFDFEADYLVDDVIDTSIVYFYLMRYRHFGATPHAYPGKASAVVYKRNQVALDYIEAVGIDGTEQMLHDGYTGYHGDEGGPIGTPSGVGAGCLPPVGCVPLPPEMPPTPATGG